MKRLALKDIGKPISITKGWAKWQVNHSKKVIVIMVIKAPDGSVLVITDWRGIATRKKCRAIWAFMERSRNGL